MRNPSNLHNLVQGVKSLLFGQRIDTAEVMAMCDYLDPAGWLPRPQVTLENLGTSTAGLFDLDSNTIRLNPLAGDDIRKVAAHEARHWWQYHVGWLDYDGTHVWWQWERHLPGYEIHRLVRFGTAEEYFNLPWERDAEDFANEYLGHLAKTLAA